MAAGTGALAAAGGPIGAAVAVGTLALSIVGKIFGGMKLRAQQAANENQALQQIVQGLDQALVQLRDAYNSGQINQQDAIAGVTSIWGWYWQSITPRIQPNRNGCASGSNCPGSAMSYQSTNGVPNGFCSGNEGASCCLGCGPIRLSIESVTKVLQDGSGTATIAPVYGDRYGLQSRASYTLTFSKPSLPSSFVGSVEGTLSSILGGGGYNGSTSSVLSSSRVSGNRGLEPTTVLLVAGVGFLGLLALVAAMRPR